MSLLELNSKPIEFLNLPHEVEQFVVIFTGFPTVGTMSETMDSQIELCWQLPKTSRNNQVLQNLGLHVRSISKPFKAKNLFEFMRYVKKPRDFRQSFSYTQAYAYT